MNAKHPLKSCVDSRNTRHFSLKRIAVGCWFNGYRGRSKAYLLMCAQSPLWFCSVCFCQLKNVETIHSTQLPVSSRSQAVVRLADFRPNPVVRREGDLIKSKQGSFQAIAVWWYSHFKRVGAVLSIGKMELSSFSQIVPRSIEADRVVRCSSEVPSESRNH